MVMGTTLRQTVFGVVIGVLLALAAGRALSASLFGLVPGDAGTLALAALLMVLISVLATYVPARRALRVDPVRDLNADY
jgi:ABC-type antimicrobial peptide transport system permease subunit